MPYSIVKNTGFDPLCPLPYTGPFVPSGVKGRKVVELGGFGLRRRLDMFFGSLSCPRRGTAILGLCWFPNAGLLIRLG